MGDRSEVVEVFEVRGRSLLKEGHITHRGVMDEIGNLLGENSAFFHISAGPTHAVNGCPGQDLEERNG